jgi:hypothetical protein
VPGQNARNKIQFNGVGGLRTYIRFTERIGQDERVDPPGMLMLLGLGRRIGQLKERQNG